MYYGVHIDSEINKSDAKDQREAQRDYDSVMRRYQIVNEEQVKKQFANPFVTS